MAIKMKSLLLACSVLVPLSVPAFAQDAAGGSDEQPEQRRTLNAVTVTASKTEERLIDVPNSVSAVGGEYLETLQVGSISELVGFVPGLTTSNYGAPGMNSIQLRGLAGSYLDDFSGPLVATYINNLPVGSSTAAGRGNLFTLDIMPYDIEGIEILRGPQGTLYGANTMGGLVKYTLKKPDLDTFYGRVGGDVTIIPDYTSDIGYSGRLSVNIPIIEGELAVLASVITKEAAGWVDNVGTGRDDANSSEIQTGRFSVLWEPNVDLSVYATALYQKSSADDAATVLIGPGNTSPKIEYGVTSTSIPQTMSQETKYFTAGLEWNSPVGEITSEFGYSELNNDLYQDLSVESLLGLVGLPDGGIAFGLLGRTEKFVHETRISNSWGDLDWIAGVYYTEETAGEDTDWDVYESDFTLRDDILLLQEVKRYDYTETAFFGNATYAFTDAFDVTVGGRLSTYEQAGCADGEGLIFGGAACIDTGTTDVSIWSVSGRYRFSEDLMAYGRVATGYRVGAGNSFDAQCPQIPASSEPDESTNYEIGTKGSILGGALTFDATLYHIEWTGMQLNIQQADCIYVDNGGDATSQGLELSSGYALDNYWSLNATLAYTDTELKEDIPAAGGIAGNRLPLSPDWAGSLAADYRGPLFANQYGFYGVSYRYKGEFVNRFEGTGTPYWFPEQNIFDIYGGIEFENLTLKLTASNIFDDKSYSGMQYDFYPDFGQRAIPITPRTFTVSADWEF